MSLGYFFVTDSTVLEFFSNSSKKDRERLPRIFDSLSDNPFQEGNSLKLRSGREVQVKRFQKWLVPFWTDHAVKEVKIIAILPLD